MKQSISDSAINAFTSLFAVKACIDVKKRAEKKYKTLKNVKNVIKIKKV